MCQWLLHSLLTWPTRPWTLQSSLPGMWYETRQVVTFVRLMGREISNFANSETAHCYLRPQMTVNLVYLRSHYELKFTGQTYKWLTIKSRAVISRQNIGAVLCHHHNSVGLYYLLRSKSGFISDAASASDMKKCMEYEVEGSRPRGRPKRTWKEVVQKDCQARNLNKEDAMDRGT